MHVSKEEVQIVKRAISERRVLEDPLSKGTKLVVNPVQICSFVVFMVLLLARNAVLPLLLLLVLVPEVMDLPEVVAIVSGYLHTPDAIETSSYKVVDLVFEMVCKKVKVLIIRTFPDKVSNKIGERNADVLQVLDVGIVTKIILRET